jgi:DNA polymerase I-like protein with 3'-5' exonuclease and polymerase domains
MSNAFAEGLFDVLPLHLQVHDELVCSVPKTKEGTQALERLHELMCTAYRERLTVPLCVQVCVGPDWGYWKDDIYRELSNAREEY